MDSALRLVVLTPDEQLRPTQHIGDRAKVEYVSSMSALRERVERRHADAIIVRSLKTSRSAVEVARAIRALSHLSDVCVIGLIADAEPEAVARGLQLGLDECISTDLAPVEMLARIEAACSRRFKKISEPLRFADLLLDPLQFKVWRNGRQLRITLAQFKLIHFFMSHPNQVFSRADLLERVWGNVELDEGAVTACIARIRRELNKAGGGDLIISTRGGGYSLQAALNDGLDESTHRPGHDSVTNSTQRCNSRPLPHHQIDRG